MKLLFNRLQSEGYETSIDHHGVRFRKKAAGITI